VINIKKSFCLVIAFIMFFLLTGCGIVLPQIETTNSSPNNSTQIPTSTLTSSNASTPTDAPTPSKIASAITSPQGTSNPVIKEYKDVMQNKIKFYDTFDNSEKYLNDLLNEYIDAPYSFGEFSILNLNNDSVPEVLLCFYRYKTLISVLIFYNIDGKVYRSGVSATRLQGFKFDGTFSTGYGGILDYIKLELLKTGVTYDRYAHQEAYNNVLTYYIGNESASKEVFDTYREQQESKANSIWNDFTDVNIDAFLS